MIKELGIDEAVKIRCMIYAELSGDFPLGDSRQPTYKSLRPFDLVS
ncbi:transposase [Acinetobacter pittii]|nr:transposase [Acinetobacter pittii]